MREFTRPANAAASIELDTKHHGAPPGGPVLVVERAGRGTTPTRGATHPGTGVRQARIIRSPNIEGLVGYRPLGASWLPRPAPRPNC